MAGRRTLTKGAPVKLVSDLAAVLWVVWTLVILLCTIYGVFQGKKGENLAVAMLLAWVVLAGIATYFQ